MRNISNLLAVLTMTFIASASVSQAQILPAAPQNVTANWNTSERFVVDVRWEAPPSFPLGGLFTYDVYAASGDALTQSELSWRLVKQTEKTSLSLDMSALAVDAPQTMSFVVYTRLTVLQSAASRPGVAMWATQGRGDTIVFRTLPVIQAYTGSTYLYHAFVGHTDMNRVEPITYTLRSGPQGMWIDAQTGVVTWTPTQQGRDSVSILATSSTGAIAEQNFVIAVSGRTGFVSGWAHDSITGAPIAGAVVAFEPQGSFGSRTQVFTMSDGSFRTTLNEGVYLVYADAPGYNAKYWDGAPSSGQARPMSVQLGDSLVSAIDFQLAKTSFNGITVGQPIQAGGFTLDQNYPNPLSARTGLETTIEFTLDQPSHVSLDIFSVAGVKIASIVSGEQMSGRHIVRYNASTLPAGAYFYQLTVGGTKLARKFIVHP